MVANRLRNPGGAKAPRFDTSTFRKEQRTGRRSPTRFPVMRCTRTASPSSFGSCRTNREAGDGRDSRPWWLGRWRREGVNPVATRLLPGCQARAWRFDSSFFREDQPIATARRVKVPFRRCWRMSDRFQQCGNGASGQPSRKYRGALGAETRPVRSGSRAARRPYGTPVRLPGHGGRGCRGTRGRSPLRNTWRASRGCSSVRAERCAETTEAGGSIPSSPTGDD